MKLPLYIKFIMGYVFFGILSFFFISLYGGYLSHKNAVSEKTEELYYEASVISSRWNGSLSLLDDRLSYLKLVSKCIKAQIWIMDEKGNITLSSEWNTITNAQSTEFNPVDFGTKRYTIGNFYNMFDEEMISVFYPFTGSYKTDGYIMIHYESKKLENVESSMLNVVYLASLFIYSFSLIILVVFHIIVFLPLKKITKAAMEYASGNLTHDPGIHTRDEMGYLSETLFYMSSELNNIEENQRRFIANVSHDFRSPLTSIKGYIQAIIDGTIPFEMQEKYLNIVLDETSRLTALTERLLELNSFDSKGNILYFTDFDINKVIKQTVATFEGICSKKGITFDLIFSSREFYVNADMGKIQQVIYNLVDNAIKFSHEGGVITIETYASNNKAFISVKDQGIGINKENIKKIWERFYKIDTSRGKDKKGTGLGLSITKEIIQAHNETIDVISTEGVGTEFIFRLKLPSSAV